MPEAVCPGPRGFASCVIEWQKAHGRHHLPWQKTADPYRIWLSEIMLQQTQVQTVMPYYERFLARFPTLEALAGAPIDRVLEVWSGLGYYARARNLHRCAQVLVINRAGRFSADPEENAALPGIGRSTAAAIAVFAFGRRAAILDGNVKRVLGRCFALAGGSSAARAEREMWALAESLLPDSGVESYSQGMMDLGATVCTRHQPACHACPLRQTCVACREGRQAELPQPRMRARLPLRSSRLLLLSDGRRVLLERRPPSGIWGGLLSLPELGDESPEALARRHGCRLLGSRTLPPMVHSFSHFRLRIEVVHGAVDDIGHGVGEAIVEWLPVEQLAAAALPAPIRKLLLAAMA
ncbi:MAG: A/G-specific adenine glycosylase [Candidatus Accumulibacter sp.]|uniref:A/G-specific adenine glycosylase n=1 Tax=Accumulibacter sp. TaxID=2053492 RepID=UPI001E19F4DA|nr:A/G-specific adenine glycosylase [Accumulibacter sp.]MCB1942898.1 A/G-specific adenine glycosylase [Accumulibacter sp.]MCP5248900.1 A/G-specific adenine glycosylase [Accumulibacter sp.]